MIPIETKTYTKFFHVVNVIHKEKDLTDISKLVFYDIAYMCIFRGGKCFASNPHFAKKYNKSKGTISKAVSQLRDGGYIERYGRPNEKRHIYLKLSKFAGQNGAENYSDGMNDINNSRLDDNPQIENARVGESSSPSYLPAKNCDSTSVLSNKIMASVIEYYKIQDPLKFFTDLLPQIFEKYSNYKLDDIEDSLLRVINKRNISKIQESGALIFESQLEFSMLKYKKSPGSQIQLESIKANYIPIFAEYMVIYLYDLAKESSKIQEEICYSEDPGLYEGATDTYELIWSKHSDESQETVKGRLTQVNELKGSDPKLPFANLKLTNSENQELIIQVGSEKYQTFKKLIIVAKGEDVAIHGKVQYSERFKQNIVKLYDFEIKEKRIQEEVAPNEVFK